MGSGAVVERVFCPYCHGEMHPKRMAATGTPFFGHNPGSSCPMAGRPGESMEHLALKDRLYVAIRGGPDGVPTSKSPAPIP